MFSGLCYYDYGPLKTGITVFTFMKWAAIIPCRVWDFPPGPGGDAGCVIAILIQEFIHCEFPLLPGALNRSRSVRRSSQACVVPGAKNAARRQGGEIFARGKFKNFVQAQNSLKIHVILPINLLTPKITGPIGCGRSGARPHPVVVNNASVSSSIFSSLRLPARQKHPHIPPIPLRSHA